MNPEEQKTNENVEESLPEISGEPVLEGNSPGLESEDPAIHVPITDSLPVTEELLSSEDPEISTQRMDISTLKAKFSTFAKKFREVWDYLFHRLANSETFKKQSDRVKPVKAWIFSHRKLSGAAMFILISLSGFYIFYVKQSERRVDQSMLAQEVRTRLMQPALLVHEIKSPGTIVHLEKAAVASKILGRLQAYYANQGDHVVKGQKLAQMETFELDLRLRTAQANLNSAGSRLALAQARYAAARRNIDRQIRNLDRLQSNIIDSKAAFLNAAQSLTNRRELYQMGGASEMELKTTYAQYISAMNRYYQSRVDYQANIVGFRNSDLGLQASSNMTAEQKRDAFITFNTEVERNDMAVSVAAYRSAQVEVDTAALMLKEATIISPITGVVASRSIEIGEEVKQNEPLFTLVRMDRLLVSTNISEEEAGSIEAGQQARFTVDARNGKSVEAKVLRVSPVIDIKTRTAEVQIEFDNAATRLSPGMFVRCFVTTRKKSDGLSLPEAALLNRREEQGKQLADVYVIQNGLAFKRIVTTGERYSEEFEILEGLKPGEEVALDSVQLLKDGAPVKVSRADSAASSPSANAGARDPSDTHANSGGSAERPSETTSGGAQR